MAEAQRSQGKFATLLRDHEIRSSLREGLFGIGMVACDVGMALGLRKDAIVTAVLRGTGIVVATVVGVGATAIGVLRVRKRTKDLLRVEEG